MTAIQPGRQPTKISSRTLADLAREALRSGSIAAVAMAPFGLVFYLAGLDVNEYGRAVIQTFFGQASPGVRLGLFVVEHFLISWAASIPLLGLLIRFRRFQALAVGALYGAAFWFFINSLLLPILFNRLTPWQLGWTDIYPSLTVHVVYGVSIALTSRAFVDRHKFTLET